MTNEELDLVAYRLARAEETLKDAEILAAQKRWGSCVNRLYYACFYAASALLAQKGSLQASTLVFYRFSICILLKPGSYPRNCRSVQ